jgi:NADH-quinone oxidoreductase subunit L
MALLPAAVEKLLGIYLLARLCVELYPLSPGSPLSTALMSVGAATIICAVMLALVQRDYKRLLSFHAISQVGYMVLGVGTATPVGVVGGVFHMLNHALYKSCLFLTAGLVEKQAGTTDLARLGGLRRRMPWTCATFIVAALAISGVPPLNGFFSKELVYAGALARGAVFYGAALLGSLLTAASFLKLGHAAYFGAPRAELDQVREGSLALVGPAAAIAAICVLFGVYNPLPLRALVQPALAGALAAGQDFAGLHLDALLITGTLVALGAALLNHRFGVRRGGAALAAVDHIHHAPVLHPIYDAAEAHRLDPYAGFVKLADLAARGAWAIDRALDALIDRGVVWASLRLSAGVRAAHTGSHGVYLLWAMLGVAVALLCVLI